MRRIETKFLALALWGTAALIAAAYGPVLAWSWAEFRRQLDGRIGSPPERLWYRQARELLDDDGPVPRVRELLERSIAVEPAPAALCLLGEYFYRGARPDDALSRFEQCRRLDPFAAHAYLRSAEILAARGDKAGARRLLVTGLDAIKKELPLQKPRPDATATSKSNSQAEKSYEHLKSGLTSLQSALRNID